MSLSIERLAEIKARLEAASARPWDTDTADSEDGRGKYKTWVLYDHNGKAIADAHNADAEIHEELDEHGINAWDEIARCNFELIAAAPTDIADLLAEVERLKAESAHLRTLLSEIGFRALREADGESMTAAYARLEQP